MINKKDLLKDIRKYSPEQIAMAVRNGEVSMYELIKGTGGAFTPLLKMQVNEILASPIHTEHEETTKPIELSHSDMEEDVSFEMDYTDDLSIETVSLDLEETEVIDQNDNIGTSIDNKQGMFSRPFSFRGRIRRTEYGLTIIIGSLINTVLGAMIGGAEVDSSGGSEGILVIYFILLVPYLWLMLAQGAKRCHDLGNSGFIQLIPLYGIWMLFEKGDPEPNKYGNSPK